MKTQIKNISNESFNFLVNEFNAIESDTLLIVIDHQIWSLFNKDFDFGQITNKKVLIWKAPDGEKVKNFNEYQTCVEFFIEKGIHRKAHLIAIGGGATSDFAGFVAATILRGIDWSVVPTTLLAMVDASIGGKVALNSKHGKNLIGAFHMPSNVWIHTGFLKTLGQSEMNSGLGEILKYAFLEYSIYDLCIRKVELGEIIKACASYKEKLVKEDFKENGVRKYLNLGHSFGHAIEVLYNLPHGVAVAWGMALIFKLFGSEKNLNDFKVIRESLGLNLESSPWLNREFPVDKVMNYLSKDKKLSALAAIDLILIKDIGSVEIQNTKFDEISTLLEEKKDELKRFTI